jgi:hypothetical protein
MFLGSSFLATFDAVMEEACLHTTVSFLVNKNASKGDLAGVVLPLAKCLKGVSAETVSARL